MMHRGQVVDQPTSEGNEKEDDDKDEEDDGNEKPDEENDDDKDEDNAGDKNEDNSKEDEATGNEDADGNDEKGEEGEKPSEADDETVGDEEPITTQCSQVAEDDDDDEVDIVDDCSDEILYDNYDEDTGDHYLLHVETTEDWMRVMDPRYGCTIECGLPAPDLTLVSKSMIKHKEIMAPILEVRKETIDYCFIDDDENLSDTERLVSYGKYHFIPREDLTSLAPGELIYIMVTECWSMLLNDLISRKVASDTPLRIFMGLGQSDALATMSVGKPIQNRHLESEVFFVLH
ncbi:uncharacterized protein LOC141602004 [Silene latifolia]|uniref:uncharacterized protein LOC141602004 n=1 Tax=Silene latifolia TaxID=37657 RepID=UPI003D77BEFF